MWRIKKIGWFWEIAVFLSLFAGCLSCGCNGDGGKDSEVDTDTWTDIDWGEQIPCENRPRLGEKCVPGGKYVMGCVPGDVECRDNEKPLVEVTLSPFFVDEMEATNEELIEFLNTLRDGYDRRSGSVWGDKNRIWSTMYHGVPIELNKDGDYAWLDVKDPNLCWLRSPEAAAGGFGWYGAKLYCEWKGKRLPTEAQWEASARGQTFNEYPCGSDFPICAYGHHGCCHKTDECPDKQCIDCCIPFEDVSNCESPFGVKNQIGNASEWVMDWMDDKDDHSWCKDGCKDPKPRTGKRPISKGGGVGSNYTNTRISYRCGALEDGGSYSGVRCVRPDEPYKEGK